MNLRIKERASHARPLKVSPVARLLATPVCNTCIYMYTYIMLPLKKLLLPFTESSSRQFFIFPHRDIRLTPRASLCPYVNVSHISQRTRKVFYILILECKLVVFITLVIFNIICKCIK